MIPFCRGADSYRRYQLTKEFLRKYPSGDKPSGRGQWVSALRATPPSPKGANSVGWGLTEPSRPCAHDLRTRSHSGFELVFISILTPDIFLKARHPSGRSLPSAVKASTELSRTSRSVACRPPPHPLRGWLLPMPGPERNLYAPVPVLYRSHPSVALWLLTLNSLVIGIACDIGAL